MSNQPITVPRDPWDSSTKDDRNQSGSQSFPLINNPPHQRKSHSPTQSHEPRGKVPQSHTPIGGGTPWETRGRAVMILRAASGRIAARASDTPSRAHICAAQGWVEFGSRGGLCPASAPESADHGLDLGRAPVAVLLSGALVPRFGGVR